MGRDRLNFNFYKSFNVMTWRLVPFLFTEEDTQNSGGDQDEGGSSSSSPAGSKAKVATTPTCATRSAVEPQPTGSAEHRQAKQQQQRTVQGMATKRKVNAYGSDLASDDNDDKVFVEDSDYDSDKENRKPAKTTTKAKAKATKKIKTAVIDSE